MTQFPYSKTSKTEKTAWTFGLTNYLGFTMDQINPPIDTNIPNPQPPMVPPPTPKPSLFLPIFLTFLITSILIIGGYFGYQYFKSKSNSDSSGPTCTLEAKMCPDGTSVGRTGPNCEFLPCPAPNLTADWETFQSPLFSYNFKYPSTWYLSTFEKNNDAVFGSNSLQNYSPTNIEKFMDHGLINWREYLGDKIALKIDYAVYSKKPGPNQFKDTAAFLKNLLSESAQKLAKSDLTIGNFATEQYKQTTDLGPTNVPEINTFIVYPSDEEIMYVNLLFWNTPSYEAVKNSPAWQELSQILSTFRFNDQPGTDKFTERNKVSSPTILNYSVPPNWTAVTNVQRKFEISFDPTRLSTKTSDSSITLFTTSGTKGVIGSFTVTSYDNGSRHTYLQQQMGEPLSQDDKLPDFKEIEYQIQGKKCLVYDGYNISQSGQVWGMCPLTSNTALFFNLWRDDYIATLKTLKFF